MLSKIVSIVADSGSGGMLSSTTEPSEPEHSADIRPCGAHSLRGMTMEIEFLGALVSNVLSKCGGSPGLAVRPGAFCDNL